MIVEMFLKCFAFPRARPDAERPNLPGTTSVPRFRHMTTIKFDGRAPRAQAIYTLVNGRHNRLIGYNEPWKRPEFGLEVAVSYDVADCSYNKFDARSRRERARAQGNARAHHRICARDQTSPTAAPDVTSEQRILSPLNLRRCVATKNESRHATRRSARGYCE